MTKKKRANGAVSQPEHRLTRLARLRPANEFWHRTRRANADAILAGGFRDAIGTYLTSNEYTGVWISNIPLDGNEGAHGDSLLRITIDESLVGPFEWIEEGKGYREFLVPAAILNEHGVTTIVEQDDDYEGWPE